GGGAAGIEAEIHPAVDERGPERGAGTQMCCGSHRRSNYFECYLDTGRRLRRFAAEAAGATPIFGGGVSTVAASCPISSALAGVMVAKKCIIRATIPVHPV